MAGAVSQPTTTAEFSDFNELMAIMKGGEASRPIDSMADKIKSNMNLLKWVDKEGATALQRGILEGCQGEKVAALIAIDSSIAKEKYKGRLPLHMALEFNPKEDVLDRIIEAYKPALQIPDVNDGRLPLHLILEHQPFPMQFLALGLKVLQSYPQAARKKSHERLPIQICLDHGLRPKLTLEVIKAFRSGACVKTKDGKLPLHIAVEQNCDPRVIDLLIEANPAALIAEMAASLGQEIGVLEYAIRNRRSNMMIVSLMYGGSGKNPKAVAYARAAAVGRITKNVKLDNTSMTSRQEYEYGGEIVPGSRRKLHFFVQPLAGEEFSMVCDPSEKVEQLKQKIEAREGTPAEKMRLTMGDRQLMNGQDLSRYGLVKDCRIQMQPVFEVLQQALRHGAEKDSTLQLLEMRPESAAEDDQYGALPLEIGIINKASEEVVLKLVEQFPPAARKPCCSGGGVGEYPLHIALRQQYSADVIGKLVEGCSSEDWTEFGVFSPDGKQAKALLGLLPLHMAISAPLSPERKLNIINRLLHAKCPIEARCPSTDQSALDIVLSTEPVSVEVFKFIYEELRAARPNVAVAEKCGKNGQCPLHVAVIHNAGQVVIEKLCKVAPNVLEIYDVDNRLPIHLATSFGANFAVVKCLLAHGPKTVLKTDGHGKTPLQLAVSHKAQPGVVFEICRTDRRTIGVKDVRGRSLLELALSSDAPQWVIQELLEASPSEMNNLNLLSGKWPNTKASSEALRFAFEARKRSVAGKGGGGKGVRTAPPMSSDSPRVKNADGQTHSRGFGSGPQPEQEQSIMTTIGSWFGL